jgi:hypothetical protein
MMPLERLRTLSTITEVDPEHASAFVRDPLPGMLLIPGDPLRPEVNDVAVVLTELVERFPAIRVAVASIGQEATMRGRFGVAAFPALLFVKGGEVVTALSRMQAWSAYETAARALGGA